MYSLISFDKHMSYDYYFSQDTEYVYAPEKFLHFPLLSVPSPHPKTLSVTDLMSVFVVLPFPEILLV